MLFIIRPIEPHDYEATVALCNQVDPERNEQASAWQRAELGETTSTVRRRWVAVHQVTHQVLGYASFWLVWLQKFRMDLIIDPAWRQQGIGGTLWEHLLAGLNEVNARTVQARVWDENVVSLQFLQRRRFREMQRMYQLRLDLRSVNMESLLPLMVPLSTASVEVTTLHHAVQQDPACWRKLTKLHNTVVPHWPDPDPGPIIPVSPEAFQRQLTGWNVIPEAFFIAHHQGHYIGYSGLARRDDAPHVGESGGTAVHPAYRGRGIATALKVYGIQYARQHGFQTAATRSANPAMVRVNEKLGFQRGRCEVRLVKSLIHKE